MPRPCRRTGRRTPALAATAGLRCTALVAAIGIATLGGGSTDEALANTPAPSKARTKVMSDTRSTYEAVPFASIPGWAEDDHAAAFAAFERSCASIVRSAKARAARDAGASARPAPSAALVAACEAARDLLPRPVTAPVARGFFERHFTPHRVVHAGPPGMVTGYYEPILDGARQPTKAYSVPVLRRPADLVNLVSEADRGAKADQPTHARVTADGRRVAYPTRQEIDEGALAGLGLEILYLKSPVDLFFMQVQGSGRIRLPDGRMVRLTYDGKNGHPYTSVGRYLIDTGQFAAEQVSLQSLEAWLEADAERGRKAMWQNKSYVFFREIAAADDKGPLGVMSVPLSPGRSLAVDTAHHELGLPVWVGAPALRHATRQGGFHRLMVAQDVGSAIRGPERGDIYFGSGEEAGRIAGVTKHAASFLVLLPNAAPVIDADARQRDERVGPKAAER